MISMFSHKRQFTPNKLTLSVLVIFLLLTTGSIIRTPFAVPGQQKEFFINQGTTLARIASGQEGWGPLSGIPFHSVIHQVVPTQRDSNTQFIATESGLYRWTAGIDAWTQLFAEEVFTIAEVGSNLLIGTRKGLLRQSQNDQAWQTTGVGLPEKAIPVSLALAPHEPPVIYLGTTQHGVFRSHDGGEHFEPVNQGLPHSLGVAPVTPVMNLVVDPNDADVVYASTDVNGVYKTTDGGTSWKAVSEGLPGLFPNRTYQPLLAHHPTQSNVLYTVIGFPVHSHLIDSKIYKTIDGGEHWLALANLPKNTLITSLTLIGGDPVELAVGYEKGILRIRDEGQQVDGGPYWKPSPTPLRPGATPNADVGDITIIEDDGTLNQNFDLQGRTIEFTSTAQAGYIVSTQSSQIESDFGPQVALADNGTFQTPLPFPFTFYGTAYTTAYVNANGNVTFERADPTGSTSAAGSFLQFRLGQPRIAALWEDFNPAAQGKVHIKTATDPNRLVMTWDDVRVGSLNPVIPDSNTFQIVLFSDSRIRFNYGDIVSSQSGLVGLSPGNSRANAQTFNLSRDLPRSIDNRAVLEFFTGQGLDIQATARKFYQTHPDNYDQLVVFTSGGYRTNMTGVAGALAFHAPVRNDVQGIGRPLGDLLGGPAAYGSAGRLQSFLNMNRVAFYPANPNGIIGATISPLDAIGHEAAHRWLAYFIYDNNGTPGLNLLTLDFTHWNFFLNSDASLMYGNRWQDNDDGSFTSVEATARYGVLDEYAIGLRPPGDVNPVFFINQPQDPAGRTRNNLPEVGVTVNGNRTEVSLDQIVTTNGPRVPAFGSSPTALRQAYVLVIPEDQSPIAFEIEKIDRFRQAFEPYFNQISHRKAVVDTRLVPGEADLSIEVAGVDPPMLKPGDQATVSFTIKNRGTAAAGLVVNEVRYSEDNKVDSADAVLKKVSTTSLASDESATLTAIPVVIPRIASAGTHYITLVVNAGGAAVESDEVNNQISIPITVVGGGLALVPSNEAEPNDRMNQSTSITPDTIISGQLNNARDVDFYSFNARAGQSLTVDLNARSLTPPSPANTFLTLFDSTGTMVAENDDFAGSPDSFLALVIPRSGQYFIRVRNAITAQTLSNAAYQAVVILRSASITSEVEPNNGRETATPVVADVVINGVLNPTNDQDFFVVTAGAGQVLAIDIDAQSLFAPSEADTLLSVFDSTSSLIAENDDFGESRDSFLQVPIPRSGQYVIRIRDLAGRGGTGFTYKATVRLTAGQTKQ